VQEPIGLLLLRLLQVLVHALQHSNAAQRVDLVKAVDEEERTRLLGQVGSKRLEKLRQWRALLHARRIVLLAESAHERRLGKDDEFLPGSEIKDRPNRQSRVFHLRQVDSVQPGGHLLREGVEQK